TPSREVWEPCEPYHQHSKRVNECEHALSFEIGGVSRTPPLSNGRGDAFRRGARGVVEIRVRVRERDERRLELRRRKVDAALEHPVEERGVALLVGAGGGVPVRQWALAGEARQH